MKKYLISIILLCFISTSWAGNLQKKVIARKNAGGPPSCTEAISCTTNDDYWPLGTDNYQMIQAQGSEITICKITLIAYDDTSGGTITLQIWDTSKSTQYGSDSGTVNIDGASDPGEEYEFTFATNPVVPNADFRIYINEGGTGDVAIRASLTDNCYDTDSYYLYTEGVRGSDAVFGIYTE